MENDKINEIKESIDAHSASQDKFFANINHELKTPINVIKGINELILHENTSEVIKSYVENSITACSILEHHVNRLITFSRIISQKIEPIVVPFSLSLLMDDVVSTIASECKKNNIQFDFEISPSIPDSVSGDSTLISQIIFDIIMDAIYNSMASNIQLSASWQYERQNEGGLIINILTDINTPDDNLLTAIKERLKLSHKMIEYLNGFCNLSYTAPTLSFKLSIPLSKNEIPADTAKKSSYITKDARILIVDDYLININVIAMLLKETKIHIDSSTSAAEALRMIEKNDYDIIFIDYMMPVMDGAELMCKIRESFPEKYKRIPFYVLSANTNTESRKLLTECGFNGFIPKPIDPELIRYIIRNNLPEDKLTYIIANKKKEIPEEEYKLYKSTLAKYNIDLDNGLNYFSGDLEQYATIIEQLNKSYKKSIAILKMHYEKNDIKGIQIFAHTVKGNSKQIGSNILSRTAALIEENAAMGNISFIGNSKLLFFDMLQELNQATNEFMKIYYNRHPDKTNPVMSYVPNKTQYKNELYEYIDNMEAGRALSVIYSVIANHIDNDNSDRLSKMAELIDDLEYNDALIMLKEIM